MQTLPFRRLWRPRPSIRVRATAPTVFVVESDSCEREAFQRFLEGDGLIVESYACAQDFLNAFRPNREACLLTDADLPGMQGVELMQHLRRTGHAVPTIIVTGFNNVPLAVVAMKAGASDVIVKPIGRNELLATITRALAESHDVSTRVAGQKVASEHIACLTPRQHEIMVLVLAGQPSKCIAASLHISQRTVENHRASIMKKTGALSLPALARMAFAADSSARLSAIR